MMKEIRTDLNSNNVREQIKETYCCVARFAHKMAVKTWELESPDTEKSNVRQKTSLIH